MTPIEKLRQTTEMGILFEGENATISLKTLLKLLDIVEGKQ